MKSREIICGIYKITNPKGRIYIGQAIDIYFRWNMYRKQRAKNQRILQNSFIKYGVENHVFEIIETCHQDHLNYYEIYYIWEMETYGSKHGMNCTTGGEGSRGHIWSEESKKRMSELNKAKWIIKKASGKPLFSVEHRKNLGISAILARAKKKAIGQGGQSDETKRRKGVSLKLAWAKRKSNPDYYSEVNRNKRSADSKKAVPAHNEKRFKIILNVQTGIFYKGIESAAETIGINAKYFAMKLSGKYKNNTSFIIV